MSGRGFRGATNMLVARKLRRIRCERAITQEAAGLRLDPPMARQKLGDLERGMAHITMERLVQFCEIYDVPVSTFVNDEMFARGPR